MKIQIETSSYNARRYGKPWIARVTFDTPKGEFHFGEWVGQVNRGSGESGLLIIEAEPGDVISRGQKDFRGNNGNPEYYVVKEDGSLEPLDSKVAAFKHYQSRAAAKV